MTREQRFDYPQGASISGIRFRPGMARPFLLAPPQQLTDLSVPLEDLWLRRARELTRQLDDAPSLTQAMRVLLSALRAPLAPPDPVSLAVSSISSAHGNVDLDRIASEANLSLRQFRRRCLEETGLSPKLLCRILRFRYASGLAHASPSRDWSAIALEANYFDQSHFIRDFRQFTGLAPMAVFSNTTSGAGA